ncbi:ABC transporter substrate-binding protein [Enterocloster citroniae]|uniref:ABC transporter substrate-binding protein n=1 Tax=Enterocloster citroniae TaxID=358743 RepID=UPI00349EFA40
MRKRLALLLAGSMLTGLLGGCAGSSQKAPATGAGTETVAPASGGQETNAGQETKGPQEETKEQAGADPGKVQDADGQKVMDELYAQIADKQIELELWTGPDWKGVYDSSVEGGDYLDFFNFVKSEFEAKYPNIKVNPILIDGSQRAEKLAIAIQSGTLPNMYYESDFALSDYVHEGLMVPLDDIVTEEDRADIPKSVWDSLELGGKTYIFPFSAEVGMMGINVSLFKEAGAESYLPKGDIGVWTPEKFKSALEAVKGLDNCYPFAVFANSQQGDSFTNMLLRMYGGKFVNDQGTEFTINDEKGVKALDLIVEMKNEGLLAPGGETLSHGDVYQMFLNKNLAVVTLNNLTYNNLVAGLKNGSIEEPFEFKWAYYPNEPGETDPYCLSYVKGGAIFNTGDEAETIASKLFVRFFCSEPYTEASKVLIPVRQSKLQELKDGNQDIHIVEASEALGHMVSITGRVPGYVSARSYYFPEIQAVLTGQKTPKEALDQFVKSANEAISKAAKRSVILNP